MINKYSNLFYSILLKVKNFKTPTVKKKLLSVMFILTANEHILTEFWLQIVEVAITSVGISVQ